MSPIIDASFGATGIAAFSAPLAGLGIGESDRIGISLGLAPWAVIARPLVATRSWLKADSCHGELLADS